MIEVVPHGSGAAFPVSPQSEAIGQALACTATACPVAIFTLFPAICVAKGHKIALSA